MIDGRDGIDACYHYAGIVGVCPKGLTLRRLFEMSVGRAQHDRQQSVSLATLVWSIGTIDLEQFVRTGSLADTGAGGPVRMNSKLAALVAEKEAEMKAARESKNGN